MFLQIKTVELSDLVTVYCRINRQRFDRHFSSHQVQYALVRNLLEVPSFSGHCLVAPTEVIDQVALVLTRNMFETFEFRATLSDRNLEVIKVLRSETSMVEACFKFTLVSKLCPEWSRLSSDLVQGGHFFQQMHRQKLRRIAVDVNCLTNGTICLRLKADLCKVHLLESWQLRHDQCSRWVYLLPKMGRGQAIEILQDVPKNGCFADYCHLRRYWRESYGYELPSERPPYFVNVVYGRITDQPFLYPSWCVLTSEPQSVATDQSTKNSILQAFKETLFRKVKSILGVEAKFEPFEPVRTALITVSSSGSNYLKNNKLQQDNSDSNTKLDAFFRTIIRKRTADSKYRLTNNNKQVKQESC